MTANEILPVQTMEIFLDSIRNHWADYWDIGQFDLHLAAIEDAFEEHIRSVRSLKYSYSFSYVFPILLQKSVSKKYIVPK